jgi:vanillate O-demethylase monooxygenase subunit
MTTMLFPKNAWYAACIPSDIGDKPFGRKICNQPMVFYRGAGNQAYALEDWCPHRGAPLSLGFVKEGNLVCGYHGLEMGCDGKTVAMPGQRVRGFPPIKTFPVIERYGFVWVWPGDPALADPAKLPHLAWAEDPEWAFGGGMFRIECDYRLLIDNLMDLTHETYVHSTSIGQPEIDETPCKTTVDGDKVVTSRLMEKIPAPPFWQVGLEANGLPTDQPVDRWQICRFVAPSSVLIDVGVALAGQGGFDAPAGQKAAGIVVDIITPETDTTVWYFWGLARNFRADDKQLTEEMRERQGKIFTEDLQMLESQQRNIKHWPQRELLKLNIDTGGVQARRVIERLIAAEQGGPVMAAA